WLARALVDGGELTTVESSADTAAIARRNFEKTGVASKVKVLVGNAQTVLRDVKGPFDLVFNDIDKAGYPEVLEPCVERVRVGGLLVTDNVLWRGDVARKSRSAETAAIRTYNERLAKDLRMIAAIAPLRDAVFERSDVDPLVKRAIYTTMIRCVSEVVISKGPRVLMVKAVRGFSKGYWNIPGGFMDYGEGPETGVKREAEEEIGADVSLDRLLNIYVSGFPGKPAYTLGFVYRGHVRSEKFSLKADEIEAAAWFTVDKGLTLTRNPFAKWGLVDFFLQSLDARRALRVKRHGPLEGTRV